MNFLSMNALWIVFALFALLLALLAVIGAVGIVVGKHQPTIAKAEAASRTLLVRQQEIKDIDEQLNAKKSQLAEVDKKESEVSWLEKHISELKAQIATLDPRRKEIIEIQSELEKVASELADNVREVTVAKAELEGLQSELERGRQLQADLGAMERRQAELSAELAELEPKRIEAADTIRRSTQIEEDIDEREQTLAKLDADIDAAQVQVDVAVKEAGEVLQRYRLVEAELEQSRLEHAALRLSVDGLEEQRSALIARIGELGGEVDGGVKGDPLQDLATMPAALEPLLRPAYSPLSADERAESAYLQRAKDHIKSCGLQYHDRTIRAFHTALKISHEAPITVLSGISGTGKTKLPEIYSEAMGIGFLPMPVQPRWDSPQDLLGFYNFIEKKYKATELARAMWQLDERGDTQNAEVFRDRMLLVLLDEMNLARVEYYFAEFLSRLEMRPSPSEPMTDESRRNSQILIEVPDLPPVRLYPGHNLLFTGTMNEDESTQALSDKVLDRGNMLRFPAPKVFHNAPAKTNAPEPAAPLSRSVWDGWRKEPKLHGPSAAKDIVSNLATRMANLERPFGHRVGQAMLAYAENYPAHEGQHGDMLLDAMADQVEMRLLPKLRGIELDASRDELRRLASHVQEELRDDALAEAIEKSIEASDDTGRFAWRGLAR